LFIYKKNKGIFSFERNMENNQFLIEADNENLKYISNQFSSFSVSNYSESKAFFLFFWQKIEKKTKDFLL